MWTVSFLIYIAFIIFEFVSQRKGEDISRRQSERAMVFLCIASLLIRVLLCVVSYGYQGDINSFRSWAMGAAECAPWHFYDSIWCDYPPGYIYILGIIGFIEKLFPDMSNVVFVLILKLPACICDILAGVFIYRFTKKYVPYAVACGAVACYLLNPATMLNSAMWGQVDSVFLILLLCTLCYLYEEKYYKSAVLFGICIIVKMQAIMFAPLFVFVLIDKFLKTGDKKLFLTFSKCILLGLGVAVLLALPFATPQKLLQLYINTTTQYPYASLNAFNLFAALGKNTVPNSDAFLGLTYKAWGNIGIVISVLVSGIFYIKSKAEGRLFYSAALLISMIFVLSSDMHERYLFPAMALFLVAAVLGGDFKAFFIYLAVTLSQYVNVGYVYLLNKGGTNHCQRDDICLMTGGALTAAVVLFAAVHGFLRRRSHEGK